MTAASNRFPSSLVRSAVTLSDHGKNLPASSPITTNAGFTVNTGSTFDVSASNHLVTIKGNYSNSGTVTTRSGNIFMNGTAAQTIGGTSITNFYDTCRNFHIV